MQTLRKLMFFCLLTTACLFLAVFLLQFSLLGCCGLDSCGGAWLLQYCGLRDRSLAQQSFFCSQFCHRTYSFYKLLLVTLVLGCIALQCYVNALHRGIPCTFALICPFVVVTAVEGLNCCCPYPQTQYWLFLQQHRPFQIYLLVKSIPIQEFWASVQIYTCQTFHHQWYPLHKMQHNEMLLYSCKGYVYYNVCIVQLIPSPSESILRPKITLYQLFQVFPDYKVPIQVLTLQPISCIISQ